jgi:hypothetical protein
MFNSKSCLVLPIIVLTLVCNFSTIKLISSDSVNTIHAQENGDRGGKPQNTGNGGTRRLI